MPDWREAIRTRLAVLSLEPSLETDITEELAQHAEDRYQELLLAEISAPEARLQVLAELCDAELPSALRRLDIDSERAVGPRPSLRRVLPFSARVLARHWQLTSVAVVSLAVAIAASVIGISFFNALLLRLPAVASPGELVTLYSSSPSREIQQFSFAEYKNYRDDNRVFSGLAAYNYGISMHSLKYSERNEIVISCAVSENYFQVLGLHPAAGVFFSGNDSVIKPEVVLSYSLWQRFGGSPEMIGRTVYLSGRAVTVVGVAPRKFTGTVAAFSTDLWTPIRLDQAVNSQRAQLLEDRHSRWFTPIGRLKPGVMRGQAQADVSRIALQVEHDFPATNKDWTAKVIPAAMLPADQRDLAKMLSWAVMGIVFLVLIAACVNVTTLLLGMAAARRQEILIRLALGATRWRLVRQLLLESGLLTAVSGLLGFMAAYAGLERLYGFRPVLINGIPPLVLDFRPDLRVVAITVALILLVALAIGIVPALYTSLPSLAGALNGEVVVGGSRKQRVRNVLTVLQTTVCILVLTGAGLCLRSIENLKRVPLGFSARNLVAAMLAPSAGSSVAQSQAFYERLRQKVSVLPGVVDVTMASSLPLEGSSGSDRVTPEGRENDKENWAAAGNSLIEGNYFSIVGIPLLSGRTFNARDTLHSPEVAIVNRNLAEKYWPAQDPVGKRLRIENGRRLVEIVGVAGDSKYNDLDEPPMPYLYLAVSQHPQEAVDLTVIASTAGDPRLWIEPLRSEIHKTDPFAFCLMTTIESQISLCLLLPKIIFACVSGFGLMGLLLSMAGLYATTSYSVSERRKEIGIRIALGAQPRSILTMLLRQAGLLTLAGLGLGIGLGLVMSSLLRSLLYGIRTVELPVLAAVLVSTALISLVTTWLATRPWLKADPLEAVRHI